MFGGSPNSAFWGLKRITSALFDETLTNLQNTKLQNVDNNKSWIGNYRNITDLGIIASLSHTILETKNKTQNLWTSDPCEYYS